MKSRTKPALRVVPAAQVQLTLNVQGVLRDVQQAFYGLCVNGLHAVSCGTRQPYLTVAAAANGCGGRFFRRDNRR